MDERIVLPGVIRAWCGGGCTSDVHRGR